MRNRKDLEEAIAEGRGVVLADGTVVTRAEDLPQEDAKPEPTARREPAGPPAAPASAEPADKKPVR